jgi:glutathione S-transferase
MDDFILHQFDASPFSEKARLILGAKRLAWRAVEVPKILPKPDVIALTGGYRRTPFLQRGADIWCDTALIARVLDRAQPEPPLYPSNIAGIAQMLAQWADSTLFWTVIPYTLQPVGVPHVMAGLSPEAIKAFAADRAPFTAGMTRQTPADAANALRTYLDWLETHLGDGPGFLVRGQLSIADFSVAHCLWFVHLAPPLTTVLEPCPRLRGWYARMHAFGHGSRTDIGSGEAIAVAAASSAHEATQVEPGLGFEAGDPVTVMATDYGRDLVPGTLVGLTQDEVVIERHDERAGRVHVHFPRLGFQIKKDTKT